MAGGNECQSWILLKTQIRRFGDSWSWQPSTKKSSPKEASLLIDMQYLGLLLFGDVDVGLAIGSIKIEGRCNSDMAGGNECQSWILLQTRIRRFGDSWSWQPSPKKSSPKNASLLIDMQYLGLLLFGDVDVGLAMGSIKIEGRCNSDMAGGNECQSWVLLNSRKRRFGDSWSWQPSTKRSSPQKLSLVIDMHYLGLLYLEMWKWA